MYSVSIILCTETISFLNVNIRMAKKTRKRNLRKKQVQRGGISYMFINDENTYNTKDEIDKFITEWYNFTLVPFDEDYQNNIDIIKKLSLKYSEIIPRLNYGTLKPGDITYYAPGNYGYALGHIETILGREDLMSTAAFIIRSHPVNSGSKITISEVSMLIDESREDDRVVSFRYIGPNANLINATSALISKLFIAKDGIEYGGFCSIMFKHCEENEVSNERTERLRRAFNKLFEGKDAHLVCSGFSILMCQLAFYIHGMEDILDQAMPFSAKQCSPLKLYNLLLKLPEFWEHRPFPVVVKPLFSLLPKNKVNNLFSTK